MAKIPRKTQASKEFQGSGISEIKSLRISDLVIDDRNANAGTDLGKELLRTSVSKFGAGRGVLVDRNLKLIAGNHTVRELRRQGIDSILVVPTDGKTLVVTQRTDVDKDSKLGHELAIADNRVGQANLHFDAEVIEDLVSEFDLDLGEFAMSFGEDGVDFGGGGAKDEGVHEISNVKSTGSSEEKQGQFDQSFFPLSVALSKNERDEFDTWKAANGVTTDTEGFQLMFKKVRNI